LLDVPVVDTRWPPTPFSSRHCGPTHDLRRLRNHHRSSDRCLRFRQRAQQWCWPICDNPVHKNAPGLTGAAGAAKVVSFCRVHPSAWLRRPSNISAGGFAVMEDCAFALPHRPKSMAAVTASTIAATIMAIFIGP
jgi:hypothetical protein